MSVQEGNDKSSNELPIGWEVHVDEMGQQYFWHVTTGITQWEFPKADESVCVPDIYAVEGEEKLLSNLTSGNVEADPGGDVERCHKFVATSLGWLPLATPSLSADHVSQSIQQVIEQLSRSVHNNLADSVASWGGDGKRLVVEINTSTRQFVVCDEAGTVLTTHIFSAIRAWGIGTDGTRDFAYVVRDATAGANSSVNFQCHVLRCEEDGDASRIATLIFDGCNEGACNNNGQNFLAAPSSSISPDANSTEDSVNNCDYILTALPRPAEGPRKVIQCHYVGSIPADGPVGTCVLNEAVSKALQVCPVERWAFAAVTVSPSEVIVRDTTSIIDNGDVLLDLRVRYLTFVGISAEDVHVCCFISHEADDSFTAHVFHCEPSAGPLSKAIEAACELRFQKCLDLRRPEDESAVSNNGDTSPKALQSANRISATVSNFASSVARKVTGMIVAGSGPSQKGMSQTKSIGSLSAVFKSKWAGFSGS